MSSAFPGTFAAGTSRIAPSIRTTRTTDAARPRRATWTRRATTGTEAIELALQLAVTRTGRRKFVSIEDAYHGNSFGARTVGSDDLDAHLPGVRHLAPPLDAAHSIASRRCSSTGTWPRSSWNHERVAAIAKRAKQRGLLVYPEDDSLVMFPALTIDEATCGEALDILAAASR